MNELMYINDDTLHDLENYLLLSSPPGILLYGEPGLGKGKAAHYLAARLLSCSVEKLYSHPDYYITGTDGAIKVEDIENLLYASMRCSVGNRKIFIILHANTMTKGAQNRLLKLLEDNGENNILILTSEENVIIPTICSRCYTVMFHALKDASMKLFLKTEGIKEDYLDMVSFLLSNAPYQLKALKPELDDYINLYSQLSALSYRADIFPTLHHLKEKDKDAFYERHKDYKSFSIRFVLFPFYDFLLGRYGVRNKRDQVYPANLYTPTEALAIVEKCTQHLMMKNYNKNNFFDLLRFIVQVH